MVDAEDLEDATVDELATMKHMIILGSLCNQWSQIEKKLKLWTDIQKKKFCDSFVVRKALVRF